MNRLGRLTGAMLMLWPGVTAAQTPQPAPLRVVVTIKPVHALALQVLDGVSTPVLVVDNASPHTYALKPSDAKLFNDADVVIRVSEQLEPFTARVVKSIPKSVEVVTLDKAAGIATLPRRTGATFEAHEHGAGKGHAGHGHGHAHSAKSQIDGHLWLSPANAKAIIQVIARTATARRPAHAETIAANAARASARIDILDQELRTVLATSKGRPYVVFHDALQYFEAHYGLTPAGSITVDPDVPPSAKRLSDVRAKLKRLDAACVFTEPGIETRVAQSVTEGTSAKTGTLDPEALTVPAGADAYDGLMRKLGQAFRGCLQPAP